MVAAFDKFKQSCKEVVEIYRSVFNKSCSSESVELGVETGIVSYILTRYVLKKPQYAFSVGSGFFLISPIIYWPICKARIRSELMREEELQRAIKENVATQQIEEV